MGVLEIVAWLLLGCAFALIAITAYHQYLVGKELDKVIEESQEIHDKMKQDIGKWGRR